MEGVASAARSPQGTGSPGPRLSIVGHVPSPWPCSANMILFVGMRALVAAPRTCSAARAPGARVTMRIYIY